MASPAGPQYIQVITSTGPKVGATIEYSTTGGAPQAVYSDSTLMTSLGATLSGANASDSEGRFPIHWLDPSLSYKRIIKLSDGSTWRTDNPVQTADTAIATALAAYVPLVGGNLTGPVNINEGASIASASTINLTTATGEFLHITGTTGISTMTLAQGERILIFDGALILTHSSNLVLPASTNITTVAGDMMRVVAEGGGVTRCLEYRLVSGKPLVESSDFPIKIGDETTALAAALGVITFRLPYAMTLDAIPQASLTTASSSGPVTIDINVNGSSILSTKLVIDELEESSATAGVPAVLSSTSIAANSKIVIDIDTDGTSSAGLQVTLMGIRHNRP